MTATTSPCRLRSAPAGNRGRALPYIDEIPSSHHQNKWTAAPVTLAEPARADTTLTPPENKRTDRRSPAYLLPELTAIGGTAATGTR